MNTLEQLDRWLAAGDITREQHGILTAISRRDRLSVFLELNALLYLGVIACAGGAAWTVSTYAEAWGNVAILLPLTAVCAGCFACCFLRGMPYSRTQVPAPGLAFDYVLYLGCLVFAVELGYIEYRFHLLQDRWDYYLLASSLLYAALAYRFDNRFVLSLGIATLGAWFGVRFTRMTIFVDQSLRTPALIYGMLVAAAGTGLHRAGIKKHFLDTYLHVAANVGLAALASGAMDPGASSLWTAGAIAASGAAIAAGARLRSFAFVVYGVVYGYIAVSTQILRHMHGDTDVFAYIAVTATAVVVGLVALSRTFGRRE